jgi:hypothetical protein
MSRKRLLSALALIAVVLAGCSADPSGVNTSARLTGVALVPLSESCSKIIGPAGGELSQGSATVSVPAGALAAPITLTLFAGQINGRAWCEVVPSSETTVTELYVWLPKPAGLDQGSAIIRAFDPNTNERVSLGGMESNGKIMARAVDFGRFDVEESNQ